MKAPTRIGTAGWAIPREVAEQFPSSGTGLSGLQRYAARFNCAEINSSFYRPHRRAVYERWREATPPAFAFAVKAPRVVTHERRLAESGDVLTAFLEVVSGLGGKLGPILFQLPPSLTFDAVVAGDFFGRWRALWGGLTVCEPRHATWFEPQADALLAAHGVARAAADPARVATAAEPGGWRGLAYNRLHGSPRMYVTPYGPERLEPLAAAVERTPGKTWIIFDNTMSGAAARDALWINARLSQSQDLQRPAERLGQGI